MKKKVKKMMEWFYDESYRGEQNIAEFKNLYDLIEKLQYRLEDMESEHMQLIVRIAHLEGELDNHEHELRSDQNHI